MDPIATATTPPRGRGGIPLLGHTVPLLRGRMQFFQDLRLQGDLVLIHIGTRPVYVLNSPDLIHRVLVTDARNFDKGKMMDKARPFTGNGLVNASAAHHRRQRRMIQPSFHRDMIAHYGEVMIRSVGEHTAEWRDGQRVRVDEEIQRLVMKILTATLFASPAAHHAIAEVHRSLPVFNDGITRRTLLPELANRIPTPGNRRFDRAAAGLRSVVQDLISIYRRSGEDHGDLLSMLVSAQDVETGQTMTDKEVQDETITLLVGALETVTSLLVWLFHVLGENPEIDQRVHTEVADTIGDRPIQIGDYPKLAYTRSVVCEALRLHHPLWILMRRAINPIRLGQFTVPAGAELVFSQATLHRDPVLYPAPMTFRPERWLDSSTDERSNSFIPFGGGSRLCIGDRFAWMEMVLVLAASASRWRLVPVPGHRIRPSRSIVIHPGRLPMELAERTH
ncbi:Cytochrome P450 [Streptomyces sp. yr375]|uniref:cytochrome P450 n=1 Tax=Streptomyces sp. yr375 TaxID=1761906 RepID=UPI0008CE41BC|nr:cytochrome P450 [Streptomyces sp. yr375]SER91941.1 Cytochrome P450 [Streptomyces sp. yr375]